MSPGVVAIREKQTQAASEENIYVGLSLCSLTAVFKQRSRYSKGTWRSVQGVPKQSMGINNFHCNSLQTKGVVHLKIELNLSDVGQMKDKTL